MEPGGTIDLSGELRDYVAWHAAYDDPESSLSKRLRAVQAEVGRFLDETAPREVRILSACAGDGRDVLDVLAGRSDGHRVSGTFIEILDELADRLEGRIGELGLSERVAVRRDDAGWTDAYLSAAPADLVVLSGIMGNITPEDIERLVHTARSLCTPGATVLWTRGRMAPDLGPEIRGWFDDAGFECVRLHEDIEGSPMRLGVERLVAEPTELLPGRRIFTFRR